MSAPRWRFAGARTLAVAVALVVLATIEGWSPAPAHAANLSGAIGAVRAGQIAAEASMRGADLRIASLTRAKRGAARHVRTSRRRHDRFIDRRADAREHGRDVRAALAAATTALERAEEELAALTFEPDILGAALAAQSVAAAALAIPPLSGGPLERSAEDPGPIETVATDRDVARLNGSIALLEVEVDRLRAQSRQADRSTRRIERLTRRAGRRESAAKRRLRSIRAGIGSATGQQRSAEASLAAHIHSMTRLAYLRANKKTKGRAAPDFVMPVQGRISQGYHAGHDGLDIVAGRGTPIRAMAQGAVVYVGWNPWDSRPRAFVVVIAHQGGYETKYGHLLPRRGVMLGKLVRRGEVIGYMGNTGHSTGVHLHLEVSRGYRTMNPYAVL
jgi:murein DD-endopeptidase MepM/ murein hydrolase activator NlpD